MSKALAVAWREFRQTALTKMFILAVIGLPIFIIAIMAIAVLLISGHEQPPLVGTVAVADTTGEVVAAARVEFDRERMKREFEHDLQEVQDQTQEMLQGGKPNFGSGGFDPSGFNALPAARGDVRIAIESADATDPDVRRMLQQRIDKGELIAAAIFSNEVLDQPDPDAGSRDRPRFQLLVGSDLVDDHTSLIERKLGAAVVRVRAERAGMDPDKAEAMLRAPASITNRVLAGGETMSAGENVRGFRQIIPMFFMMLLWVSTFTAGQHLMMSTIEEKSNRVMEVLLSAVSPMQLMVGKVLGHGAVGLLIVTIYTSLGLFGLGTFALMHLIDPMSIVYLAVYFFMAYFMVATIFAAVGSAVTDIREANTLITPVMIAMMVPFMLWLPISHAPNGTLATACSFIPPVMPFAMILRLSAEEAVPMWQVPVTAVWGYICVIGMIWFSAKIFRIGVLMYGKPPNPLELVKWLRYR